VLVVVSLATSRERDPDREQYTFGRFKRPSVEADDAARPFWQHDRLWACILVACTLWMCWFFA